MAPEADEGRLSPVQPAAQARRPQPLRDAYLRVCGRIFFPRRQSASALSMSSCTSSACRVGAGGRQAGSEEARVPPSPRPRLTSTSSQWKKWTSGLLWSESWHTSSSTDG